MTQTCNALQRDAQHPILFLILLPSALPCISTLQD